MAAGQLPGFIQHGLLKMRRKVARIPVRFETPQNFRRDWGSANTLRQHHTQCERAQESYALGFSRYRIPVQVGFLLEKLRNIADPNQP